MATLKTPLGRNPASRYLRWAELYAGHSEHPIHRVGAVIVANGNLHTGGCNKNRSHPKSPHKFCIHAEVDVLLKARDLLNNYDMFVVRLTKGGKLATSKPCPRCLLYIKEAGGIDSVTYINEEGEVETERL